MRRWLAKHRWAWNGSAGHRVATRRNAARGEGFTKIELAAARGRIRLGGAAQCFAWYCDAMQTKGFPDEAPQASAIAVR